jgi:adenylosuccinate synthase
MQSSRPNSISVEDAFFGDSGKGSVVVKCIGMFKKAKLVYSLRFNGGANAGHETLYNGTVITTHQLPIGLIFENTTSIITRGAVIHPTDLVAEIERTANTLGGIPGKLIIDERAPLCLDTHRAREIAMNHATTGGHGSTGRGIASAYESVYGRYAVTMKDLMAHNWKDILGSHYDLYAQFLKGFGASLAQTQVKPTLQKTTQAVGSKQVFLQNLSAARNNLKQHTMPIYDVLSKAWADSTRPFVLEGAQGPGLDPYHGVYPDVTASRPMTRNINDATYNIILPEEIRIRAAVMKTTYVSSVGTRVLPASINKKFEKRIQKDFDEKGRTTGRLRDIYYVSLPIATYLQRASGYNCLVASHLDASKGGEHINITTKYIDKKTGKKSVYFPYQDSLDNLTAKSKLFKGWDGEKIKTAKSFKDLPAPCKTLLKYYSTHISPIWMATYGADVDDYILLDR